MKKLYFALFLLTYVWFGKDGHASGLSTGVPAPVQVLTSNADNYRDGWFSRERFLNPVNVGAGSFGKLFTWTLFAGRVNAQLLIVPQVVTSSGQKDLLIAIGMTGTIYALDANNWSNTPVWSRGLAGGYQFNDQLLYNETVACLSTPVADPVGGFLYVVCTNSTPTWTLMQLDLATGATLNTATVTGQYPGTGDPMGGDTVIGGQLQFKPNSHVQRAGLILANGNIYVGFGSNEDFRPWHGWVFGFNASTLAKVATFCTSPSNYGSGIWGAGAGFSVDASGNLYAFTGNGGWDGVTAFGESIIKLNSSLSLLDWFTPSDHATMESNDSDMSSSRAMLMATANGSTLLVGGAKDFRGFIVDSLCMGHLQGSGSGCTSPQLWLTSSLPISSHVGIYGGAFANSVVYLPNTGGNLYAYQVTAGIVNTTPIATSSATFAFPGSYPSVSSNWTAAGSFVVWAVTVGSSAENSAQSGVLRAFNASTLVEIYNSSAAGGDTLGQLNKFAAPVVWNGHVFVGSGNNVLVYGLGAH